MSPFFLRTINNQPFDFSQKETNLGINVLYMCNTNS